MGITPCDLHDVCRDIFSLNPKINVEEKKEKYIGLEVHYRMAIARKVL